MNPTFAGTQIKRIASPELSGSGVDMRLLLGGVLAAVAGQNHHLQYLGFPRPRMSKRSVFYAVQTIRSPRDLIAVVERLRDVPALTSQPEPPSPPPASGPRKG